MDFVEMRTSSLQLPWQLNIYNLFEIVLPLSLSPQALRR